MKHRFYGQNVDVPLSLANNTPDWDDSILGELYKESSRTAHLTELEGRALDATHAWRVVDAKYLNEDGTMSYFRAYDLDGSPIAFPVFGVTWGSCDSQISGGFKYRPPAGNRYYVPIANNFHTQSPGGYGVLVLDRDYPSETFNFGLLKKDYHQAMVISFRLFALGAGYPNDLNMEPR